MLAQYGKQGHDITGHLLQANMEAFCLEAGLQGDIFHFPVAILEYLTKTWFTSTWMQCQLLDVAITTDIKDFKAPQS